MTSDRQIQTVRRIERIALCILAEYMPGLTSDQQTGVREFYNLVTQRVISQGMAETIKFVKATRTAVMQYLTDDPLSPAAAGMPLDDTGFPLWLPRSLKVYLPWDGSIAAKHVREIRLLLTLLTSLRGVMLPPTVDLDSIISPYAGSDGSVCLKPNVLNYVLAEMMRVGYRCGVETRWDRFHFSMKAGPMGPALLSAVDELALVYSTPQLRESINLLGGPALTSKLQVLEKVGSQGKRLLDVLRKPSTSRLSKISYFSDREGKTRIVAICDYWTQTALKPYHKVLMSLLSKLPRDCTYNHDSHRYLSGLPGPYYSLDLSNATDRMPLWLQKAIMGYIFGDAKAEAWANALTSRWYALKVSQSVADKIRAKYSGHENIKPGATPCEFFVRYGAGQPMGAYSSWASMAFTHHFIVQWAAYLVGWRKSFTSYTVLGDDVVIADSVVAESYKGLLQTLNMPYSVPKTHVSSDSWEFAKRWYIRRHEVTAFSIAGIESTWKSYALLGGHLYSQAKHGWAFLGDQQALGLVSGITKIMSGRRLKTDMGKKIPVWNRRQAVVTGRLLVVFQHWLSFNSTGSVKALDACLNAFSDLGAPISELRSKYVSSRELFLRAVRLARVQVLERDIRRFQSNAAEVVSQLLERTKLNFPGETQITSLAAQFPAMHCLANLYSDSLDAFGNLEKLELEGIAKYYIGKNLISRVPLGMSEAAIIKSLLGCLKGCPRGLEEGMRWLQAPVFQPKFVEIPYSPLTHVRDPKGMIFPLDPVDAVKYWERLPLSEPIGSPESKPPKFLHTYVDLREPFLEGFDEGEDNE